VLEGKYFEIICGMSRQPITMSGIFHLERQAVRPLSTRRPTGLDTGVEPVVTKTSTPAPPLAIPAGASRTNDVIINTEMDLRSLQVTLNFSAPLAHASLYIRLRSPGASPAELVLYDGRNPANAINSRLLESLVFPLDRPVQGDLDQFLRSVPQTKAVPTSNQFWRLIISNTGAQGVTLTSWSLRLEGQPLTDVSGMVKDGNSPLAGVTVALNGVPFSMYSGQSGADGRFALSRVPLLPLNFAALRPGYVPADPANPGLSTMFTRPFIGNAGLTFSPLETQLIGRFNPLAGAPVELAGVAGFASGTTNSPFELQLAPELDGPPAIIAGPLMGFAGNTLDFYAVNPAGTVSWDFGDGTISSQSVTSHVFQVAGHYKVKLFSPAGGGAPQATVDVVVMPAPGNAPLKPLNVAGEPTGLPAQTAQASYAAYIFQPFFTTAGVLPAHKVGTYPNGADRYVIDLTPQDTFAAGETNAFGAAFVSLMPIQHGYAASMDIDLAPHLSPANTSKPFESDGFTPLNSPGFDPAINVNELGFKNEDFNYAHVFALWANTRTISGSLEYTQDPQNGLIVWGNALVNPNINYAAQPYDATDGTPYAVTADDATFHPHPGTTIHPDSETYTNVTHFRMVCSIGATILTAPTPSTAIKPAKPTRSQPDNPLDPDLLAAPGPVARNLYFRLHTGFLGVR
jgi:hypothetical protein